jgi:hypothetical protein
MDSPCVQPKPLPASKEESFWVRYCMKVIVQWPDGCGPALRALNDREIGRAWHWLDLYRLVPNRHVLPNVLVNPIRNVRQKNWKLIEQSIANAAMVHPVLMVVESAWPCPFVSAPSRGMFPANLAVGLPYDRNARQAPGLGVSADYPALVRAWLDELYGLDKRQAPAVATQQRALRFALALFSLLFADPMNRLSVLTRQWFVLRSFHVDLTPPGSQLAEPFGVSRRGESHAAAS